LKDKGTNGFPPIITPLNITDFYYGKARATSNNRASVLCSSIANNDDPSLSSCHSHVQASHIFQESCLAVLI
jgi:hypothetical protein